MDWGNVNSQLNNYKNGIITMLTYKEFITIFNPTLAREKSWVVEVEALLENLDKEMLLFYSSISLDEEPAEGIFQQKNHEEIEERLKLVVETIIKNNFEEIAINFENYPITKQSFQYLVNLLNNSHCREIGFTQYSDFNEEGFKFFISEVKKIKSLPRISFHFNEIFNFSGSSLLDLTSALIACSSKNILFNFQNAKICKQEIIRFFEALFTSDLSAKNRVMVFLPKKILEYFDKNIFDVKDEMILCPKRTLGYFDKNIVKDNEKELKGYIDPFINSLTKLSVRRSPKNLFLNMDLNESEMMRFTGFLKESKQLPAMKLSLNNKITDEVFIDFIDAFSHLSNLEFALCAGKLTTKGIDALCRQLKAGKFNSTSILALDTINHVDHLVRELTNVLLSPQCAGGTLVLESELFSDDHIAIFLENMKNFQPKHPLELCILGGKLLSTQSAEMLLAKLKANECPLNFEMKIDSSYITGGLSIDIHLLMKQQKIKNTVQSLAPMQQKLFQQGAFAKISQPVLSRTLYPFLFPKELSNVETKHLNNNIEKLPRNILKLPSL